MKPDKITVAIIGCGNIAGVYARQIQNDRQVATAGFFDTLPDRAPGMAAKSGGRAYATLEEALHDPDVDVIVNLPSGFDIEAGSRSCVGGTCALERERLNAPGPARRGRASCKTTPAPRRRAN